LWGPRLYAVEAAIVVTAKVDFRRTIKVTDYDGKHADEITRR